uniref:Uncharacterized protein n=1 Tax=Taeniopygia guttata TaxID=59729 RepID=A0A674HTS3_TAEGU
QKAQAHGLHKKYTLLIPSKVCHISTKLSRQGDPMLRQRQFLHLQDPAIGFWGQCTQGGISEE